MSSGGKYTTIETAAGSLARLGVIAPAITDVESSWQVSRLVPPPRPTPGLLDPRGG